MILVGGEALFDLVLRGEGDDLAAHPGGGPFTTARTLARLGRPAAYLGRLSTDRFGQRLRALLEEDGVALDAVVSTDEPTTLALAEFGADGGAAYRFYARGTSAPGLTVPDALAGLPDAVEILHVGSVALVLEPTADALEAVVERLAGRALVLVDPNVRPWVIDDPTAYRARLGRLLALTDVVKLSEEDIAWLDPDRPPDEAVRALGPALGLLTLGPRGALVVLRSETVEVPVPAVQVADTIGAGDAFGGGFLAWWHERGLGRAELADRDAVVEATTFACLVAARTCERPGADPPRRDELG